MNLNESAAAAAAAAAPLLQNVTDVHFYCDGVWLIYLVTDFIIHFARMFI